MRKIRINLIVLLLFRFCLAGVQAQETIPIAGGDASGTEGSISYTVGQLVFSTVKAPDGTVIQGVQQPYVIAITKGSDNALKYGIECMVYPNPVKDRLILRVESNVLIPFINLSYRLYTIDGILIQMNRISDAETVIPMNNLAMSTYILQVFNDKNALVEFTIIKN